MKYTPENLNPIIVKKKQHKKLIPLKRFISYFREDLSIEQIKQIHQEYIKAENPVGYFLNLLATI